MNSKQSRLPDLQLSHSIYPADFLMKNIIRVEFCGKQAGGIAPKSWIALVVTT